MKTIQELVPLIQEWAKERKIYEELTPFDQLLKTHEEVGELIKACYDNDKPAIQDAIGDTMICLINYCYFIELDVIKKIKRAVELSLPELDIITRVIEVYKSLGRLISINMRNGDKKLSEPSEIRVFSIAHSLNEIALLENTTLEECLNIAYNEIKNRTGKMINGKFMKDKTIEKIKESVQKEIAEKQKEGKTLMEILEESRSLTITNPYLYYNSLANSQNILKTKKRYKKK